MREMSAVFAFFAALFAGPFALLDWSGDGRVDAWVWQLVWTCVWFAVFFGFGAWASSVPKNKINN